MQIVNSDSPLETLLFSCRRRCALLEARGYAIAPLVKLKQKRWQTIFM
ncbi:hypothetical protein OGM63_11950 [Plectonema radiosum NIES-515]|uniref:Uncharacterized protein n=1 Tax=Plectonema radiosum NIES-515 TaxID=2986073 RepID=A0ABT3AYK5_9CYAN|nr:hypothetical protein [Plectonema radiosum NIES-515]